GRPRRTRDVRRLRLHWGAPAGRRGPAAGVPRRHALGGASRAGAVRSDAGPRSTRCLTPTLRQQRTLASGQELDIDPCTSPKFSRFVNGLPPPQHLPLLRTHVVVAL